MKFFINVELNFINDPHTSPGNSPDCIALYTYVFDNLMLAVKLFAKALQKFEDCLSVNINLCGKLVSWLASSIIFYDILKVSVLAFFFFGDLNFLIFLVAYFSLLSCEFDNFTFTL